MKILLGVTGSVASTLTKQLSEALLGNKFEVAIVATQAALHFIDVSDLPTKLYLDADEWKFKQYKRGDPVLHIQLRDAYDVLLLAPLSANTLAKMATGITDNLLCSLIRAWDPRKPIIVAPAMNTLMWGHPATFEHLLKIKCWYSKLLVIDPIHKKLACGDEGIGAMAKIDDIVSAIKNL